MKAKEIGTGKWSKCRCHPPGLLQNEISGKESQGSLQGGQDFSFYSSSLCAMAVSQARLRDSMKRTY